MASFRFIHCADLHIDSPLRGLESDPDAPAARIRGATRDAFSALVDYALDNQVDFVVAAGDLYDGEWQDWRTGQFLARQVARLSDAAIPFIAIRGNHDAQSLISRELRLPAPARELSHRRPETVRLDHLGVAIHGQSFANAAVREDLRAAYPAPVDGWFNIGVLHTNVDGRPGHENYAPSALADLRAQGYHYWALGHVHTRAVLSRDPCVIYPGNPQGRHARETGPRGAYLVTVADNRIVADPEFVPFDTVRWDLLDVDVTGAPDLDAVLITVRDRLANALAAADGRLLAARIRLTGSTPASAVLHHSPLDVRERIRAEAQILAGLDAVWIEGVSINVTSPQQPDESLDLLASEILHLDAGDLGDDAAQYLKEMLNRLPGLRDELRDLDATQPVLTIDAAGTLPPDLLERARNLLLAHVREE
jgi:DNA repair protein SbcD/Mre11